MKTKIVSFPILFHLYDTEKKDVTPIILVYDATQGGCKPEKHMC